MWPSSPRGGSAKSFSYCAAEDGADGKFTFVTFSPTSSTLFCWRSTSEFALIQITPKTGSFEPAGRIETAAWDA